MTPPEEVMDNTQRTFEAVSTATIATALFRRGLRNTVLHGLYSLSPVNKRMVGAAFTIRYIPAREDIDTLDAFEDYQHPQRAAIEQAPPGSVLVADCRGNDRAAAAGHILLTRLQVRGAAGFVTDGSVRDSGQVATLRLPVFVRSRSAMTNLALHHAVDINVPIACAGVAIYPGDTLVGDEDGVICVPQHLANAVAIECTEMEGIEDFITHEVRNGAPLRDIYPPSEATRERYRASRKGINTNA